MTSTPAPERRRGRPSALTREHVEDVAFELVQEHGYDGSSMRELAKALGVSAMAVQRITGGRDALDESLVTRLIESERERGLVWTGVWREDLTQYALVLRRLCGRHPAILAALSRRPLDSPYAQEVVNQVIATLVQAGFSPLEAGSIFLALRDYVTGHALVENSRTDGAPAEISGEREHLHAARAALSTVDYDEQFFRGLELLLAGVQAQIAAR